MSPEVLRLLGELELALELNAKEMLETILYEEEVGYFDTHEAKEVYLNIRDLLAEVQLMISES